VRLHPLPVVAKWLGNTPAIAMRHYVDPTDARHYVDPTDADFERAVNANLTRTGAQIPAQQTHAKHGKAWKRQIRPRRKTARNPKPCNRLGAFAMFCPVGAKPYQ